MEFVLVRIVLIWLSEENSVTASIDNAFFDKYLYFREKPIIVYDKNSDVKI